MICRKTFFPPQLLDLITVPVTAVLFPSAPQTKLKQVVSFPDGQNLKMNTRVQKRGLDFMPGMWAPFLAIEFRYQEWPHALSGRQLLMTLKLTDF